MQGSFALVRVLFSPFDGSKILLPFAQKTFGFYKLSCSFVSLESQNRLVLNLRLELTSVITW